MIRLAHTADIHASRARMDETLASLNSLISRVKDSRVDMVVIAGDIWDSAPSATGLSRYPEILNAFQRLADIAPVAMIYGTPSHDLAGSLEVFEQLHARHDITVLRPGVAYHLVRDRFDTARRPYIAPVDSVPDWTEAVALLLGIPEPSKEFVIANVDGISKGGSDEEIRAGMRRFLLGLAATRRQHAYLPAVVLYHGQIAGATLQNGQALTAGEGLATGRDDLGAIGADYYALGDIHLPQQVGTLPAYYSGSVYPGDRGETHQCGWNLVDIDKAIAPSSSATDEPDLFAEPAPPVGTRVQRIDYPHPQWVKISITTGDRCPWDPPNNVEIRGKRVWLEYECDHDEHVDIPFWENALRHEGALAESQVTLKTRPRETVRAADIAEKTRLREKVAVYADQTSHTTVSDLVYDLADRIEREHRSGATTAGAQVRIDRLLLRGAIGIWKGLRTDEIDVDLSSMEPGLVALIGANGKGKTTLIENMHPWPQMLTRDGKLAAHFRLRDSRRELHFTDLRIGSRYKAVILIDSQSGNGEYHLYRLDADAWTPLTNGLKDSYLAVIGDIFGSLALFLKSAFISQKPSKASPDIQDATKGERKALFIELAGLEHLQEYAQAAKVQAEEIERQTLEIKGRIGGKREQLNGLPELRSDRETVSGEIGRTETQLSEIEQRGKAIRAEVDAAREAHEAQRRIQERVDELNERLRKLRDDLERKRKERSAAESAAQDDLDAIRTAIAGLEQKQTQLTKLYEQKQEHDAANATRSREYLTAKRIADEELEQLRSTRAAIAARNGVAAVAARSALATEVGALERQLNELTSGSSETCPVCDQPWPEHKRAEHEEHVQKVRVQLEKTTSRHEEADRRVGQVEQELAEADEAIRSYVMPTEPELPEFPRAARIRELTDALEWDSLDARREQLRKAEGAEAELNELTEDIADLDEQQRAVSAQVSEAERDIDPRTAEVLADRSKAREDAQKEYSTTQYNLGALRSRLQSIDESIQAAEAIADVIEADTKQLEAMTEAVAAWRFLEVACGRDGIQALELDALAPSIAQVANELLESAYGTRFTIEFRTTRLGGTGARQKQIEDFLVMVIDAETGTEQELKTLSGGEAVWIKKAIYDAFGIILARNNGTAFLTAFQDEHDGVLDPEAKQRYFRMMDAAHRRSGRAHTIVITHSPEIQQMIRKRIEMEALGATREGVAA